VSKKTLRRYSDITSLIYLLTTRTITLLDPATWDDSNDSHYLTLYKERKKVQTVLALCFTQTSERYHYWRVFGNGASGVCTQFYGAALLKAVRKQSGLKDKSVEYVELSDLRTRSIATDDLPFLKRYAFRDEDEFRLLCESATKMAKLDIPIPLSCIQRITLSPWIHPALSKCIKDTLHSIEGCGKLKITRSTLIGNEEWKLFGEEATSPSPAPLPVPQLEKQQTATPPTIAEAASVVCDWLDNHLQMRTMAEGQSPQIDPRVYRLDQELGGDTPILTIEGPILPPTPARHAFFVDHNPRANWEHWCSYVFVGDDKGVSVVDSTVPPSAAAKVALIPVPYSRASPEV